MQQQKLLNFSTLLAYFFTTLSVFFGGCTKDIVSSNHTPPDILEAVAKDPLITVDMARDNFEKKYGSSLKITPNSVSSAAGDNDTIGLPIRYEFSIMPTWSGAKIASYLQTRSVLVVPVEPILMLDMAGAEYALIYYRDSSQQMRSVLQVYMSNNIKIEPTTTNFSGGMFQISMDGKLLNLLIVENGVCQSKRLFTSITNGGNRAELLESPDPSNCPTWGGGGSGGGGFWSAVVTFFSGFNGGGNAPIVLDPNFGLPGADPNFSGGNSNGGSGSNGNGGGNALQEEIDNNLFGVSRTRLIRVVNYLGLTDSEQVRSLIYDQLLVSHIDKFINNSNTNLIPVNSNKKDILLAYYILWYSNPTARSTIGNAGYPDIGSVAWVNAMRTFATCNGVARFEGFTDQELQANFRGIPEDGNDLIDLQSGQNHVIDGFFFKGHTPDKYWFKISAGGLVVVTKDVTEFGGFRYTVSQHDELCFFLKNAAFVVGLTPFKYWVGWNKAETLDPARVSRNPF